MAKTGSVSLQMKELLDDYVEEVQKVTDEAIKDVAAESVAKLRNTSPKGASGRYARGWTVKKDGNLGRTVYNKTDYQLTHLLENGHVVKPSPKRPGKKGRVNGIKHIAPVEEWAASELPLKISRGLS